MNEPNYTEIVVSPFEKGMQQVADAVKRTEQRRNRNLVRRIFQPRYYTFGGKFYVEARRWWSPQDRRLARKAAVIASAREDAVAHEMQRRLERALIFGEPLR